MMEKILAKEEEHAEDMKNLLENLTDSGESGQSTKGQQDGVAIRKAS
jgi:bacterioferritin (cytochrome b1)